MVIMMEEEPLVNVGLNWLRHLVDEDQSWLVVSCIVKYSRYIYIM